MAKKNDVKRRQSNNAPVENLLKSVMGQRDGIYRQTYSHGDKVLRDLDKDLGVITGLLNDFLEDKEKDNGNIVSQLGRYANKKTLDAVSNMSRLEQTLNDGDNLSVISSLYNDLRPRLELYNDFETLYELIPQLKDAAWTIRDNILSPDDFSKYILNITYDDNNTNMASLIKNIKKNYKIDKNAKKLVEKTLIYGEQYVAPIPYKDAFNKILDNKEERGMFRRVSESSINNNSNIERYTETQTKRFKSTCKDILICEGAEWIDATSVKNVANYYLSEGQGHTNISDKVSKINLSKLGVSTNKGTSQDGIMGASDKKDRNLDINGTYVKYLDVKKIIPIYVNDTCLGYYYIEIDDSVLSNVEVMSLTNVSRISLTNPNLHDDAKDRMYKDLAEVIYNNLDKNFIENNRNIKEFIFEMVQYYDALEKRIKIIYLRPEEVVCFKINEDENNRGRGIFYDILFIAKIYLSILITNTMMRLTRKPDKRVYYIKQGVNPEVGRSIQNALIQLKKDQGSIYDINHISRIMSYTGRFSDLFIPVSDGGEKPIDFDIMAGQDVDMKDEFIESIERVMVNGTGVPNALYNNYGSEVDYARTLSMANGRFIRLIVSYQLDFEEPLTKFMQILCKNDIDYSNNTDGSYNIDSINVSLPSPTTLNLTNSIDLYASVNQMVENIIHTMFGDDQNDPALIRTVRKKLVRNYMPNIDWEYIEKLIEQAAIESATENYRPKKNEENM